MLRGILPGGYFTGEDPRYDGRAGQPRWANGPVVRLVPSPSEDGLTSRFSLWRIPGRKYLFHEGNDLQLWSRTRSSITQLRLAQGIEDSGTYAYVLTADQRLDARICTVREVSAPYES